MLRLRHLAVLLRDLVGFSSAIGAIWLVPMVVMLLVLAVLVTTVHVAAPYVVYTFF